MNKSIYSYIQYIIIIFFLNCASSPLSFVKSPIDKQVFDNDKNLKILSWNIKMFSGPYGWFLNQNNRAENITKALVETEPYDIIFFQEAFSGRIREKIYSELQNIYPYNIEPNDNRAFYRINSGLWVISRIPIALKDHISFTNLLSFDKLSSKGAKLFSVIKNKQEFHFIHTHLQSNNEKEYKDVRIEQYSEINQKLIIPYEQEKIPTILIGDFNISEDSDLENMLKKLKLQNGPLYGIIQNSIISTNKLVDYILVKSNNSIFHSIKRKIVDFSKGSEKDIYSDHYPIEGIFNW